MPPPPEPGGFTGTGGKRPPLAEQDVREILERAGFTGVRVDEVEPDRDGPIEFAATLAIVSALFAASACFLALGIYAVRCAL